MIARTDTKSLLAQSLLELCHKKPVERISILELTKNCSIKRETFYYHFVDKADLINWIYVEGTHALNEKYTGKEPLCITVARVMRFMRNNELFFRSVLKDNFSSQVLHKKLIQNKSERIQDYVKTRLNVRQLSEELEFAIMFYIVALVNITEDWLLNGMKEDERSLAEKITLVMPKCLADCFDSVSCNGNWTGIDLD